MCVRNVSNTLALRIELKHIAKQKLKYDHSSRDTGATIYNEIIGTTNAGSGVTQRG
jgi:hypothetical protein